MPKKGGKARDLLFIKKLLFLAGVITSRQKGGKRKVIEDCGKKPKPAGKKSLLQRKLGEIRSRSGNFSDIGGEISAEVGKKKSLMRSG